MNNFLKTALMGMALASAIGAQAQNIKGTITCGGVGVAGVPVSDGYVVTYTDENGNYSMTSEKKNGYVFYTLPSGYEPAKSNNFYARFWQALTSDDVSSVETHDFTMTKVNNDDYYLVVGADTHLAKRTNDRKQYQAGFINSVKTEKAEAEAAGKPIYSIILGDLSWDNYWYSNSYDLNNWLTDNKNYGYNILLFPVIGNHDNDPAVAYASDGSTDFKSSAPWRSIISPNYYSFNLGKIHYVVLDDIYYKNQDTGGSYNTGVVGSRDYADRVETYEIDWLKKDLATVDKNTPVIVCAHIPVYRLDTNWNTYGALDNYAALAECFTGYTNVHILTGHTHYNLNAHPSNATNIMEHNIASVCATWWWTGSDNGANIKYQVCQDGTPAGYSFWEFNGTDFNWEYRSIAGNKHSQIRAYDMNQVKTYMSTNSTAIAASASYSAYVPKYTGYADNAIVANVYAWDKDWKVEFYEGTSTKLTNYRIQEYDPYHVLAYNLSRYAKAKTMTTSFTTVQNSHMFRAYAKTDYLPITIKATDSFGNVYYKTFQRGMAMGIDMVDKQVDYDLGDANQDGQVNVSDVTELINKILGNPSSEFQSITADLDGSGDVNVSDITLLINKILGQ